MNNTHIDAVSYTMLIWKIQPQYRVEVEQLFANSKTLVEINDALSHMAQSLHDDDFDLDLERLPTPIADQSCDGYKRDVLSFAEICNNI